MVAPPAPLGERVHATLGLVREGFRGTVLASLGVALLGVWVAAAAAALTDGAETLEQMLALAFSARLWGLLALAFVPWLYLNLVMIVRLHARAAGIVPGGLRDWREALLALPGAIAATFAYVVATTLGTLAFIVPGAYVSVLWLLWPVACVVERRGGLGSLPRSAALVAGHWMPTAVLVSVVTLVGWLAGAAVDVVAGLLPMLAGGHGGAATALASLLEIGAGVLLAPLMPAVLVVAYRQCQARQPGSSTT